MRISDWSSDVCSSDLSVDVDGDAGAFELGEAVGGLGVHRGGLGLVLGALGLELGDVGRRGRHCLALGHEVVAAVTGLDVDLVAQVAADRKSTRLNSSHSCASRMPSSACKKK